MKIITPIALFVYFFVIFYGFINNFLIFLIAVIISLFFLLLIIPAIDKVTNLYREINLSLNFMRDLNSLVNPERNLTNIIDTAIKGQDKEFKKTKTSTDINKFKKLISVEGIDNINNGIEQIFEYEFQQRFYKSVCFLFINSSEIDMKFDRLDEYIVAGTTYLDRYADYKTRFLDARNKNILMVCLNIGIIGGLMCYLKAFDSPIMVILLLALIIVDLLVIYNANKKYMSVEILSY